MQRVEGPNYTVNVDAAIERYLRVKLSGNTVGPAPQATPEVSLAGDEASLGTLETRTYAAGEQATVRLHGQPGTRWYVAAGAIAVGADTSSAAGGKIQSGSTGVEKFGPCLRAAAADGDLVEVAPMAS